MRVLLVVHAFPPEAVGGVELHTASVASALAAAGHDVVVLTRRLTDAGAAAGVRVERAVGADGVVLRTLVAPLSRSHDSGLLDVELERAALEIVVEVGPDVLHATHLMFHAPSLAPAVRRRGIPVVLSLLDAFLLCPRAHLLDVEGRPCDGPRGGRECTSRCYAAESARRQRLWRRRARRFGRVLRTADRLLAPSEAVARKFRPLLHDPSRLEVLPLGLHERPALGTASAPRDPSAPFELAFVGAIVPHKGLDLVFEALALRRPPLVRVRAIGARHDPAYLERIRRRVATLPGVSLELVGGFAPGGLGERLRGAHLVVVPSRAEETYSFVTREALASGHPVVATDRGALPECVAHGVNGRIVPSDAPGPLADAICSLAADDGERRRLADGAARSPIADSTAHGAALADVYRRAIASPLRLDLRERLAPFWSNS